MQAMLDDEAGLGILAAPSHDVSNSTKEPAWSLM